MGAVYRRVVWRCQTVKRPNFRNFQAPVGKPAASRIAARKRPNISIPEACSGSAKVRKRTRLGHFISKTEAPESSLLRRVRGEMPADRNCDSHYSVSWPANAGHPGCSTPALPFGIHTSFDVEAPHPRSGGGTADPPSPRLRRARVEVLRSCGAAKEEGGGGGDRLRDDRGLAPSVSRGFASARSTSPVPLSLHGGGA